MKVPETHDRLFVWSLELHGSHQVLEEYDDCGYRQKLSPWLKNPEVARIDLHPVVNGLPSLQFHLPPGHGFEFFTEVALNTRTGEATRQDCFAIVAPAGHRVFCAALPYGGDWIFTFLRAPESIPVPFFLSPKPSSLWGKENLAALSDGATLSSGN